MRLTRGCGLGPGIGSNTTGRIPANPSSQASISPFGPAPAMTTSVIWPSFGWMPETPVYCTRQTWCCACLLRRLIDLVCGLWGDSEFGSDGVDCLPRDVEVHLAVGGEIRA